MVKIFNKEFSLFRKPTAMEELTGYVKKQTRPYTKKYGKVIKKLVKSPYVAPTVGLFKGAGQIGLGAVKLAARIPGPLLAASVAYDIGSYFAKKKDPGLKFPEFPEYDKRGRKLF
jgi:rhamnose utilization protein RhaD (predicted bifunctional aldolase and dehydrogenase)